tara:strand:+ start:14315 stop:14920 length:606 start_codon:yes stop_codon:yes gene_type:complete
LPILEIVEVNWGKFPTQIVGYWEIFPNSLIVLKWIKILKYLIYSKKRNFWSLARRLQMGWHRQFNLRIKIIMKTSLLKMALLALTVTAGAAFAQKRPQRPEGGEDRRPSADQVRIPRGVELPTDVQTLVDQFRAQRSALLDARKSALSGLKDATAEERRAALTALRESQREQAGTQRDLARDIRRELRDLRRDRAGSGDGG